MNLDELKDYIHDQIADEIEESMRNDLMELPAGMSTDLDELSEAYIDIVQEIVNDIAEDLFTPEY